MEQFLLTFVLACIMGIGIAILLHIQNKKEMNGEPLWEGKSRYPSFISPYILPVYIMVWLIWFPVRSSYYETLSELILKIFSLFLHISMYYVVLLMVMPLLRWRISARVCGALWILPTLLYVMVRSAWTGGFQPLFVIPLPSISYNWLFFVWIGGFAAVMLWKMISHLQFRQWVLAPAETVTDPFVMRLWEEEQTVSQVYQGYKAAQYPIPLLRSERITTPLTIGLVKRSVCMVLPEKNYTEEEYRLIFRHELTHIGREDSGSKFLLAFCTAMCWFNPLMWIAMRQCAADLERSCDETVLLDTDEETKKQYAYLLLKTAGDDRGFTTCLSASGTSMRYRLQSAMSTSKRQVGSVVAGIGVFLMFFSYGLVTMSYDSMTAGEAIYQKNNPYQLTWVETDKTGNDWMDGKSVAKPIRQYLDGLQIYQLTHKYNEGEERITLRYDNPDVTVTLSDQMMEVRYYEDGMVKKQYYFAEPVDWDYLYGLLGIQE